MSESKRELPPPPEDVLHPTDILIRVLLVVAGFGLAGVAGYQMFWNRKLEQPHHLEAAQKAISEKNWTAARESLQRVPPSMRENAVFLETLAEFLKGTHSEPALLAGTLMQLEAAGRLKPDDLLWLCRASLAAGNVKSARATLERLPEDLRAGLEGMELKIAVLKAEGRQEEAADTEERLFELFPDHPDMALRRALRDLEGSFPELQQAALKSLLEITGRIDEDGLRAIRVLERRNDLTLAQCRQLQQRAEAHPDCTDDDHLAIAAQILRLSPDQRESLIAAVIRKYRDAGPEARMRLASWLARQEEHEKILELAPREALRESAELFPSLAQGLARQKRWTELQDLLKKGKKLPVSPARAAGWRALASWHLQPDDPREARNDLVESITNADPRNDALALLGAAQLAEQWAMTDLALKAYQKLVAPGSRAEVDMLEKCWQTAALLRDTATLNALAVRLASLRPDNLEYARRRDYLRLLCGEELETTLVNRGAVPAAATRENIAALLQALKAYRLQDLPLASEALRKVHGTQGMTAGERAVYAGLLVRTGGDVSRAYALAESIRPELLLAEEQVFLKMAL